MTDYLKQREWKFKATSVEITSREKKIKELQQATGLSKITVETGLTRGLDTAEKLQTFLHPSLAALQNPFSIKDLREGVERVLLAKESEQKVLVWGDYDVDGTAGAALLSWVFRDFGLSFEARQPDRFKDGYGLNIGAVEKASQEGFSLLVTVDCGITNFEAISRAKELGMDIIIIDHHQVDPKKGVPRADATINPQRSDCESGLKQLCGCGLAFYFCLGLRAVAREKGLFKDQKEMNLKQHLDLVVMATAADMVPLTGDNRTLVRHGMHTIKRSQKPGVRALIESAGLASKHVSPGHLGFVLGPRINASGRMDTANLALELLTTKDPTRAYLLSGQLEKLNKERAEIQNSIWDSIRLSVEKEIAEGKYPYAVVVANSDWHEGVVGIVASRVTEYFRRPAIVISLREDIGKGSVRSYGGKNVLEALRGCEDLLTNFGGHRFAAGLSLKKENFDLFVDRFNSKINELSKDEDSKKENERASTLQIESLCTPEDLDLKALQELECLGPFGPGNPEPVFAFRASVANQRVLKSRHLKLKLSPVGSKAPVIDAIWFHAVERKDLMDHLSDPEASEWAVVPELNRFRGDVTPTLRVRDWRKWIEN